MTRAAIDLGTNTFHLLIADVTGGKITALVKERRYVFIGEKGLSEIPEDIINRAEDVLTAFADLIGRHQVHDVKAVVTEGLRSASNAAEVLERWNEALGHRIEIIDGEMEARFAGSAVISGSEGQLEKAVAIDIGGGSIEAVLIEKDCIIDAISVVCGISVLHRMYHVEDPIPGDQLAAMRQYLYKSFMQPIRERFGEGPMTLIGIAGSFEVLPTLSRWKHTVCRIMDVKQIREWYDTFTKMGIDERRSSDLIPKERASYIVEALAIIEALVEDPLFEQHLTCPYSLKEGLLLAQSSDS